MTIAIYAVSVTLAVLCICLFFAAGRRLLGHQELVVVTMLRRYDDRLAQFAQALNDGLRQDSAPTAAASSRPDRPPVPRRSYSRARPRHAPPRAGAPSGMSVDAAVAVVSDPKREPILATVGPLAGRGRTGWPDGNPGLSGCPRAPGRVQRRGGDATREPAHPLGARGPAARPGEQPGDARRPDPRVRPAVLSEQDITTLENAVSGTRDRPSSRRSSSTSRIRFPSSIPLTKLYDRQGIPRPARAGHRARSERPPASISLLLLDVDRLTTINAHIGHLGADEVLAASRPCCARSPTATSSRAGSAGAGSRVPPPTRGRPRRRASLRAAQADAPRASVPGHRAS